MTHNAPLPSGSKKHIVPTHLNLPDSILTIGGVGISARQLLLLMLGGGISGNLWYHLPPVVPGLLGLLIRLLITSIPLDLAIIAGWVRYLGRPLEIWAVLLLRYWLRPKQYLWRSIRWYPDQLSPYPSRTAVPVSAAKPSPDCPVSALEEETAL